MSRSAPCLPRAADAGAAGARRRRAGLALALLIALALAAGLATGVDGVAPRALVEGWRQDTEQWRLVVGEIRAPRSVGAALVGALLGLGGATAQGLFRNPLADPYLLGSASGAGLAVALAIAGAAALGPGVAGVPLPGVAARLAPLGLAGAAFVGAFGGVALALALARGAERTARLLLAGVVVGVLLGALADLVVVASPEAMRARQAFALGATSAIGWDGVALLGVGLALLVVVVRMDARALDALTLGDDTAASLGVQLAALRLRLVAALAAATALAVSQAGLIAFVGLVAPHLVRRVAPGAHAWVLAASAAAGALLLLAADVLARALVAPQELPVGVVTAVVGGLYLVALLRRDDGRGTDAS